MAVLQAQAQPHLHLGETRLRPMQNVRCNLRPPSFKEENIPLIPGLPDDVAYECLLRVPLASHHVLSHVSSTWRRITRTQKFYADRLQRGVADKWICALVRGQKNCYPSNFLRAFDTKSKTWIPLPPMPENRQRRAVGQECRVVDGKVVICGGWRDYPLDDVAVFDPAENRWFSAPPMQSPRAHFVSGVVGDRLYVAGGGDGKQPRSRGGEFFDLRRNRWFPIPSLDVAISFCLGVVMAGKWFVQARGGDPGETQVFWPELGMWSAVKSNMLRWPHRPHAAVGDRLYRVDVNGGKHELMRYDADVDEWRSLGPLRHGPRRRIHELIGIDGNVWGVTDDFSLGLVHVDTEDNYPTPRFVTHVGPTEGTDRLISCHVLVR